MCFSYAVNLNPNALKSKVGIEQIPVPTQGFFFSGFDHPTLPILLADGDGDITAENAHWGLIPEWTKSAEQALDLRNKALNARSESAFEKPMFKESWLSKPCLVVSSGFFEWQDRDGQKIPYYIQSSTDATLLMAGIYSVWHNTVTGEDLQTYSILTTEANELMSEIHNTKHRMPVIISMENAEQWLQSNAEVRQTLCAPCPSTWLKAHTVSTKLNSPKNDRNQPWAIESAKIATQTRLF